MLFRCIFRSFPVIKISEWKISNFLKFHQLFKIIFWNLPWDILQVFTPIIYHWPLTISLMWACKTWLHGPYQASHAFRSWLPDSFISQKNFSVFLSVCFILPALDIVIWPIISTVDHDTSASCWSYSRYFDTLHKKKFIPGSWPLTAIPIHQTCLACAIFYLNKIRTMIWL